MRSPFAAIAIGYLAVLSLPSFGAAVPLPPPDGSSPRIPAESNTGTPAESNTEINPNLRHPLAAQNRQQEHPIVAAQNRQQQNPLVASPGSVSFSATPRSWITQYFSLRNDREADAPDSNVRHFDWNLHNKVKMPNQDKAWEQTMKRTKDWFAENSEDRNIRRFDWDRHNGWKMQNQDKAWGKEMRKTKAWFKAHPDVEWASDYPARPDSPAPRRGDR